MNLSYELARELKDAGWKFKPLICHSHKLELVAMTAESCLYWRCENFYDVFISGVEVDLKKGAYRYPTLEELIEACGEGFLSLNKGKDKWFASGGGKIFGTIKEGKTPLEALARLWLALNKK